MTLTFVVKAVAILVDNDAVVVTPGQTGRRSAVSQTAGEGQRVLLVTSEACRRLRSLGTLLPVGLAYQITASGLPARVSTSSQCMPSNEPAVPAPTSRAILRPAPRLYLRPGAMRGSLWEFRPM